MTTYGTVDLTALPRHMVAAEWGTVDRDLRGVGGGFVSILSPDTDGCVIVHRAGIHVPAYDDCRVPGGPYHQGGPESWRYGTRQDPASNMGWEIRQRNTRWEQ